MNEEARRRLFIERHDLYDKLDKLKTFISSHDYAHLNSRDQKDLALQLKHMEAFYEVLCRRVERETFNV